MVVLQDGPTVFLGHVEPLYIGRGPAGTLHLVVETASTQAAMQQN